MKRIIAHGCSCTYGHSLEDCVDPVDTALPGPAPSKMAYPQLIADTLGRECINASTPGIGNLNILRNILNFDYQEDDSDLKTGWEDEDSDSEDEVSVTVQLGNKSHKFVRDSKGRFAKAE